MATLTVHATTRFDLQSRGQRIPRWAGGDASRTCIARAAVPSYRVSCTVHKQLKVPVEHAHIVKVGVGDGSGYCELWSVRELYQAIDQGDTFYTQSPSSGLITTVQKSTCQYCGHFTVRSASDVDYDNNLDYLPRCRTRLRR